MAHSIAQSPPFLADLGWSQFFGNQLGPDETGLARLRIATVHRSRMTAASANGPVKLNLPSQTSTADFAVGDWILAEPAAHMVLRRLERRSLLQRWTEGARTPQLIAANLDTLLIVTSCNDDFNIARLERYLALANEAGVTPVIVLTKADQTADAKPYRQQAETLQRGVAVVALNAKTRNAVMALGSGLIEFQSQ